MRASLLLVLAALVTVPPAGAQEIRLPDIREVALSNGARVLLAERHDVPLVAFNAYLKGGSLTDPEGKEGVASLTAQLLRKGAGKRNASQIAEAVDGVGGTLVTGSFTEGFYVAGEFLSQDADLMVELMRSVLREPVLADSEFTKLRAQTVESIRADKDDPLNVYRAYGNAAFYGSHPYGRPVGGDEATVASLTREDVLRCYRDQFGGDRLILVVVGDFSIPAMERKLRAAFGDWAKAPGALPNPSEPARASGRRVVLVDKPDATQTYFWIGNRGIAARDADRDILDVANTAYGGTFASLLNTALRIESGLTYGASCRVQQLAAGGSIGIGSYTKTESTEKAIDLALKTLRDFRAAGLGSARIERARNYINGQFPTELETAGQLAGRLATNAFYGFGREEITGYPARIAAVDSIAVRRVVGRVYPPDSDLVIVMVGNAAKIRTMAGKYGPVREIPLMRPMIEALRTLRPGASGSPAR
ncbi:MAG TPA: pitrilysin family protein [Candidatus Eisenbacteria bacterium]|nr:pitrilysin family protein [Candidatus Eisenbacteria bacterium]